MVSTYNHKKYVITKMPLTIFNLEFENVIFLIPVP